MRYVLNTLTLCVGLMALLTACKSNKEVLGCKDPNASNYNPDATVDDGSCQYYYVPVNEQAQAKSDMSAMSSILYEEVNMLTYANYESDNNTDLNGKLASTNSPLPSCAVVTVQSSGINQWPKTLRIDFGTTNCLCPDGKYRKGVLEVRFNHGWITPPPVNAKDSMVMTLTNYAVNDTVYYGTHTFIKDSLSVSQLAFTAIASNAGVIFPGQQILTYSFNIGIQLQAGTPADYTDNILTLSIVSASFQSKDGTLYEVSSTEPLRAEWNCVNSCLFVAGNIKMTNTSQKVVVVNNLNVNANVTTNVQVDFGNGLCDGLVDLTSTVSGTNANNGNYLFSDTKSESLNCEEFLNYMD